jgi:dTDP-4-dehydrorhamnose reductase
VATPEVLLLGAGQLGRQIVQVAETSDRVVVRDSARSHLDPERRFDLGDPNSVDRLIRRDRPTHVVLVAAATNVAWCEQHPDESWALNVLGPSATAAAAREVGATVTFISTDYVFNGESGPYLEGEVPHPINVYGSHKLEAEGRVLEANPASLVVRTCQIFGDDARRANFVLQVVDRLRSGQTVRAATDLLGTPTYAPDVANAVLDLTLSGASGIWHVAGDTFLSRYELASRVAQVFGWGSGAVAEVRAEDMEDVVKRPRKAGLKNGRLLAAGLDAITPLQAALTALAASEPIP